MALPPWTRELTRDLMSGSFDEAANRLKSVVSTSELPAVAMRGLDRVIRETRKGAEQVRRWTQRFSSLSYGTINATGVFFHPELRGCPLDAEQLHALLAGEDLFAGYSNVQRERIERQLEATLHNKVGTPALVAHSMEAAIVAVAASLATSHTVVVPRCFTYRPDHGKPLPDLLRAAGGRVEEVGTADSCRSEDWPTIAADANQSCALFQVMWPAESTRTSAAAVAYPAATSAAKRIALIPYGRLQTGTAALEGIGTMLTADLLSQQWLTIVPGDALLGAPRSALIFGNAQTLASVTASPLWSVTRAELGTIAAVTATLRQPTDAEHALSRLARAGEENLQNRAERLATQLAGSNDVAQCEITSQPARLASDLSVTLPSRQLRLEHTQLEAARWAERLAAESPSLLVNVDGNHLVVDLRWLPARLDERLAALILGGSTSESSPQSA